MASLDWSQCSEVESIPGKVSGAWVLKGTRTTEATVEVRSARLQIQPPIGKHKKYP